MQARAAQDRILRTPPCHGARQTWVKTQFSEFFPGPVPNLDQLTAPEGSMPIRRDQGALKASSTGFLAAGCVMVVVIIAIMVMPQ